MDNLKALFGLMFAVILLFGDILIYMLGPSGLSMVIAIAGSCCGLMSIMFIFKTNTKTETK